MCCEALFWLVTIIVAMHSNNVHIVQQSALSRVVFENVSISSCYLSSNLFDLLFLKVNYQIHVFREENKMK